MYHLAPTTSTAPTAPITTAPTAKTARARARGEAGMSTAEYCVGTVSACGFGGLLYSFLTSGFGQSLFESLLGKITDLLPF
jgi:Protein of unknown function (DUF4244)